MGCTSSVPSVSEVHANSTDKSIQFSVDDDNHDIKGHEVNVKKNDDELKRVNGLPTCDTVHGIELVKNNSNSSEINQDNQEKVDETTGQNEQNLQSDEKLSTFKEVFEHVISKNNLQKQQSFEDASSDLHHTIDQDTEKPAMQSEEVSVPETTRKELREEETKQETASPSQSECSHATRWEALADMAAELPPSLTVDPITGHIYALSK